MVRSQTRCSTWPGENCRLPVEQETRFDVDVAVDLALLRNIRDVLGDAADGTYHEWTTYFLLAVRDNPCLAVDHLSPAQAQSDQPSFMFDKPGGRAQFLEFEQKLALRLVENLGARLAQRFGPLGIGVRRDIRQRHVKHPAAIEELARGNPQFRPGQAVLLEHGLDTLALQLHQIFVDVPARQRLERRFNLEDLHHVDRCQSAPDHDAAGRQFVARTRVILFQIMIEPVNQRVLIV